jgi:hypothetical protein
MDELLILILVCAFAYGVYKSFDCDGADKKENN